MIPSSRQVLDPFYLSDYTPAIFELMQIVWRWRIPKTHLENQQILQMRSKKKSHSNRVSLDGHNLAWELAQEMKCDLLMIFFTQSKQWLLSSTMKITRCSEYQYSCLVIVGAAISAIFSCPKQTIILTHLGPLLRCMWRYTSELSKFSRSSKIAR